MPIEIEFRGPLTKNKFQKLLRFFKKEARFVKKTKRKTFVYFTNDKTLDLKVRTTDGISEIVIKKGFWGARKREEIILPIKAKLIEEVQKFLAFLGYKKGIIAVRETYIFEYKSIEFSLVKCPKNYYFYEAEFINNKTTKNPKNHIKKILEYLELKVWSEKEVYNFLMWCNKKIDKRFSFN